MISRAILGSIVLGLIIAIAIIGGASVVQLFVFTTSSIPTSVATSSISSPPGTGVLAVQITDPPHLISGVSDVYVTYSPVMVHAAGVGMDSGWYQISNAKTIDLTKVVSES